MNNKITFMFDKIKKMLLPNKLKVSYKNIILTLLLKFSLGMLATFLFDEIPVFISKLLINKVSKI